MDPDIGAAALVHDCRDYENVLSRYTSQAGPDMGQEVFPECPAGRTLSGIRTLWLREHHSDLVFSIRQRHDHERLHVVLEHKSTPEHDTAYAVDRYCGGVTDRRATGHRAPPGLPIVISIVLYHGAAPWNAPRSLHELYRGTINLRRGLRRYLRPSRLWTICFTARSVIAHRRFRCSPPENVCARKAAHRGLNRASSAADRAFCSCNWRLASAPCPTR